MAKKLLMESMILILPIIVFAIYKKFPGNKITPYFIPKLLADRKYPRLELCQAGVACCAFALWLFSLIFGTTFLFLPYLKKAQFLLPVLFFVLPIATAMSLVIGFIYLSKAAFCRGEMAKSGLESMNAVEKDQLPRYIRKIKVYNIINLACPALLAIFIPLEELLHVAENGLAVLFNVSLLITFIMTLWRIRAYLVKAALVMDLSANKILQSTLSKPSGIFFVWVHSFLIVKKYNQQYRNGV